MRRQLPRPGVGGALYGCQPRVPASCTRAACDVEEGVYDDALAAAAAAEAARPRRITFTVAGGAFIDSFVGMWTNTTPAQRLRLCQYVLDAAAMQPACGSAAWTVQTVKNRLKNRAHHMLNAAT